MVYLEYKQNTDSHGFNAEEIDAALDSFWRDRAENGPTHQAIRQYLEDEATYLGEIGGGMNG